MSCSPRLGDNPLELVNLFLCAAESSEPLLCELAGTLVLAITEQFDDTLLIRRKTSDLLHNLTHECGLLAEGPLTTRNLCLRIAESDPLVAFVLPVGKTGLFFGHRCCKYVS